MSATMTLHPFIWLDHLVAVVICVLAPILAMGSRNLPDEEFQIEPGDKIRLYHSNALLLVVFALVVVTVWRVPGRSLADLGFSWPVWHPLVLPLIGVIGLFYFLDFFFQYGTKKWRTRTLRQREGGFQFVPADDRELLHFLLLALAAGICEEIIFRGYLIHYFLHWAGNTQTGLIAAAICSSALFAFLHGYQGWISMVKIFVLSLLFVAIFIFSRSLILVMVVHAVIDALSGWIGVKMIRNAEASESTEEKP